MQAHPMICVDDVPAASAWFQRVLGFTGGHGGPDYEMLMADGALVLQLHAWDTHEHPHLGDPAAPRGNGAVLWFTSAQVEQDYARAVQAGATVLEALHVNPLANHLEFWLRCPDGYVVVVASACGDLGRFGDPAPSAASASA